MTIIQRATLVLRHCGFNANCILNSYITITDITEAERIQIEILIKNIFPKFDGLIFPVLK